MTSPPPTAQQLLERNQEYSLQHQPLPLIKERAALGAPPPKTFIVTCIDARVVPERFLNLQYGEALVARNAGGHVRRALTDILAVDSIVNLENLFIIHHTDCGTTHFKDENIRAILKERDPSQKGEIEKMTFGMIQDLEKSVQDDIAYVRNCTLIRRELREVVQGFLFDVKTGELKSIV